jgi:predicted AlkP superfamily phosphohydrolase/phosphomutase
MTRPRVIVIGLDSVPPALAFELFADRMPCLSRLRDEGAWGPLRSTDPPITIPAWVAMTSGREPGDLGIYGFRMRKPGSCDMRLVSLGDLKYPRLWDLAAADDLRSSVVSVPLTYPPCDTPKIDMTSCFLTPSRDNRWASRESLRSDLEDRFGPYIVDVESSRTEDKASIVSDCRDLTRQHFKILRYLISTREPAFAMIVDLGPDRFHHAFLSSIMPSHPRYDPGGPFAQTGGEYYELLDSEIASTLELAGPDTVVMVVSDHGVRPLLGAVCVNELLLRKGYLVLKEIPDEPTPLSACRVDWAKTRAWGEGGYHARVLLNVAGREPEGIVPSHQIQKELLELTSIFRDLDGPKGEPMDNRVFTPSEIYDRPTGYPPDLTVYWDSLSSRSAGTVGHGAVHTNVNDTGPDDANHDPEGIFVIRGGKNGPRGCIDGLRITDVFATALDALGIDPPAGTVGRSVLRF